eukprot:7489712-Pyramimonas_sp.AAC.1
MAWHRAHASMNALDTNVDAMPSSPASLRAARNSHWRSTRRVQRVPRCKGCQGAKGAKVQRVKRVHGSTVQGLDSRGVGCRVKIVHGSTVQGVGCRVKRVKRVHRPGLKSGYGCGCAGLDPGVGAGAQVRVWARVRGLKSGCGCGCGCGCAGLGPGADEWALQYECEYGNRSIVSYVHVLIRMFSDFYNQTPVFPSRAIRSALAGQQRNPYHNNGVPPHLKAKRASSSCPALPAAEISPE